MGANQRAALLERFQQKTNRPSPGRHLYVGLTVVDTGEMGRPGWARDLVEDSLFADFGVVLDQP
ncbi:hypothetical protein GCM10027068_13450 [Prescottella soli]